jgi:hypothetical protein
MAKLDAGEKEWREANVDVQRNTEDIRTGKPR